MIKTNITTLHAYIPGNSVIIVENRNNPGRVEGTIMDISSNLTEITMNIQINNYVGPFISNPSDVVMNLNGLKIWAP